MATELMCAQRPTHVPVHVGLGSLLVSQHNGNCIVHATSRMTTSVWCGLAICAWSHFVKQLRTCYCQRIVLVQHSYIGYI